MHYKSYTSVLIASVVAFLIVLTVIHALSAEAVMLWLLIVCSINNYYAEFYMEKENLENNPAELRQ